MTEIPAIKSRAAAQALATMPEEIRCAVREEVRRELADTGSRR